MPKACRVEVLTKIPSKRREFYGNRGKKDSDVNSGVNSDVSSAVNIVNNDCDEGSYIASNPHHI